MEICLIVERTHKMNIIEKNIKDLKPYEKNPRLNDDAVKDELPTRYLNTYADAYKVWEMKFANGY